MAKIETVVFLSLVLDLFAFTIPLPLFPRIIEWYTKREASDPHGFLSRTLSFVSAVRGLFYKTEARSERWDVVLLGGFMGSLFSTLQFAISPRIGALSDKYGRRRVLLITMAGNILSALVWLKSTTFATYLLSRAIGGVSEGNVQLAIAILSDVTTPAERSKALAHVGIAFAICFIIGPPIGAYYASRPIPASLTAGGIELNIYAVPAALTLALLTAETVFLAIALPETRGKGMSKLKRTTKTNGSSSEEQKKTDHPSKLKSVEARLKTLKTLKSLHFLFLGFFSGAEFTLTFLTFDLLDWDNKKNGAILAFIGVVSAILQGGYVRRAISKVGEVRMARRGVLSCGIALFFLATLSPLISAGESDVAVRMLYFASLCMAFTSATVVNSLTAAASLQCDEAFDQDTGKVQVEHPDLAKGKALGKFRSSGQLGRAIGPLLASASYWTFGPTFTYGILAISMLALSIGMRNDA